MLVVKGFWITFAGIQLQTHVLAMEDIRPTLVLLILFVTGATTLVGASYGNVHFQNDVSHHFNDQKSRSSNDDGVYKHLKSHLDDEGGDVYDGDSEDITLKNEI